MRREKQIRMQMQETICMRYFSSIFCITNLTILKLNEMHNRSIIIFNLKLVSVFFSESVKSEKCYFSVLKINNEVLGPSFFLFIWFYADFQLMFPEMYLIFIDNLGYLT
jgi:hypothetical protein